MLAKNYYDLADDDDDDDYRCSDDDYDGAAAIDRVVGYGWARYQWVILSYK